MERNWESGVEVHLGSQKRASSSMYGKERAWEMRRERRDLPDPLVPTTFIFMMGDSLGMRDREQVRSIFRESCAQICAVTER